MATTQYNLHLKGFVGGADFDRNYVDYVLGKHVGKSVSVLIDSLGGSVATALSIASAFKNHSDVTVHFVGMNASAATIASLGAKHISIDANAMYLVHKCSQAFFEWGSLNADQFATLIADCEKIKADLDKLDCNIASMYAVKCKKNHSDLLALMQRGGWLTAQEAKDWGFVDEVTNLATDNAPKLSDAVAAEMASAGIPIPNIPVADKESAFAKFLASLASIFKTTKTQSYMNTEPAPNPTATEPAPAPSADTTRISELEAQLADRDATIASQAAEIAALKAAPGAESTAVVEQPTAAEPASPLAEAVRDHTEAREILAAIS